MMQAIVVTRTGGAEVLEWQQIPTPSPGPGQVLVRVHAAGVNFVDVYIREGRYPSALPFTPGQEGAGTVERVGEGVSAFQPGDAVAWAASYGSYAEFVLVDAQKLLPVPDGVSLSEAAAVLVQGITAHYLAHDTYAIKAGDTVLVHAGAGGVGLLLTQMAVQRGARVLTTVSTHEKAELSLAAGSDRAILYTQENFRERVLAETGGQGIPVVYDSVGKTTFEDSLRCLRPRGLLALYGASSGAVAPFDLIRLSQMGSLYVTRPTMKDYLQTRQQLEHRAGELFSWIAEGKLRVRVGHRYKLEDAAQAHRDLESRATTGKILLTA
ncbi:MAG: quinone oxidoreductase [Acidobacteriaceae bacterium]|nr:quinone oxidoreductase [Acidobacteriaceae bacterium]